MTFLGQISVSRIFLFVTLLNLCTKKKVKLKPLTEFVSQKLFHRPYNVVIIKWIWCGQAHEGVMIQDFRMCSYNGVLFTLNTCRVCLSTNSSNES